jgi:hypothetical protein
MRLRFTTLSALLVVTLSVSMMSTSCKKEESKEEPQPTPTTPFSCATCANSPEALAQYDNSAKGIYKGVVIGSSGTITFNLLNGTNSLTATLVLDGDTIVLTSNITVEEGQMIIAPFTGTYNDLPVSIVFQVDADGNNATVLTADIPGHGNAVFTVVKETSTALVEAFEGNYSKSNNETGTFNIVLSREMGLWGGMARPNGTTELDDVSGTITPSGTLIEEHGYNVGTLNGDAFSGSFVENAGPTVTVQGWRTM